MFRCIMFSRRTSDKKQHFRRKNRVFLSFVRRKGDGKNEQNRAKSTQNRARRVQFPLDFTKNESYNNE